MKLPSRVARLCVLFAFLCLHDVNAAIQITGTRVIYPADEREVTIQLQNNGSSPRLLQTWVDSGDASQGATNSNAPFMITPPITRVEPGKGQSLRLMFTGGDVPADRESVFWLNVLEIPPRPQTAGDGESFMQFAVRTRIKIFYRPKGLAGDPVGSYSLLQWRLLKQGAGHAVECTNPTAYNVSLASVRLKGTIRDKKKMPEGGTCPAFGRHVFPVERAAPAEGVTFTAINDYGGFSEHDSAFAP